MGKTLEALLRVQAIERDLAHVKRKLRARQNAVGAQQRRIAQLRADWEAMHTQSLERRKEADRLELELKDREEKVAKFRTALNTAKTNKEYASILTQINTFKADNAKEEEGALKILQEVDAIQTQANEIQKEIDAEEQRLESITQSNQEEITKLDGMLADLTSKRNEAAQDVPAAAMAIFDRLVVSHDGDAMAIVEVHGKKPPFDYICGGCFMSLNAEHANALRSRDEIRTCDNCGRILYLDPNAPG